MIEFNLKAITKGVVTSYKPYKLFILTKSETVNLQPVFTEDPVIDERIAYASANRGEIII